MGCLFFLVIIFLIFHAIKIELSNNSDERIDLNHDINERIYACILKNIQIIYTKEKQCTYTDDYGNIKITGFEKEFEYFIRNVICDYIGGEEGILLEYDVYDVYNLFYDRCYLIYIIVKYHSLYDEFESDFTGIGGTVRKFMADNNIEFPKLYSLHTPTSLDNVMTGEDYEFYIQNMVEDEGFFVKRTPITGDQGVDLIVQTQNGKVAIQCKYYSSKVGNKAVQEVNAGKDFYDCLYAAVVSNASYTVHARRLAHTLDVRLCNEDSLISALKEIDKNG